MGPELAGILSLAIAILARPIVPLANSHCDTAPWTALLATHAARYPEWTPADAYKLLHQASLGSEHAIPDAATAERWMTREIAALGPGISEPLVDTLNGGRYARVHLRPWLAGHGDPSRLTAAFATTANHAPPDITQLTCALQALAVFRGGALRSWSADTVAALIGRQVASGHRAIDHSAGYVAAYLPAYRVVATDLVEGLLAGWTDR